MTRLVVLISGTGRNLQAILEAQQQGRLRGRVCAVVSNRADATGLQYARDAAIPAITLPHQDYPDRDNFDAALGREIDRHAPDFVVLAGFMRILGSEFVQRYRGKLLNIHPSLLPEYPGLQTHRRALADGASWHGASVHFVTEAVDGGPVILQGRVRIRQDDTSDSLAERVMHEVEQKIYPEVLAWACSGRLQMKDDKVLLDGKALPAPLQQEQIRMETQDV